MVDQQGPTKEWNVNPPITTQAVVGSSIAVIGFFDPNRLSVLRVYYQDPELRLRERCFNHSTSQWVIGE